MAEWDAETAEWYAQQYGEYATNRLGVAALELAPDSIIVDIGCGTGCALRHASARVTTGKLIGIDPVARMVEIARGKLADHVAADRIEFRLGAAEKLPLEDDIADLVFAFDSFDHWQDQAQALREVHRVLRAGGRFVVVKDGGVPDARGAKSLFLRTLDRAGFRVAKQTVIEENEVTLTHWVCVKNG